MGDWKMNEAVQRAVLAAVLVVVALLSVFVVSKQVSSAEFHAKTIASLDNKKTTVMELTAASTAASAAITLVPGDVGTPIAEKLADVSTYFLLVICAIYLEEYLLTVTGYVSFTVLLPAACLLLALNLYFRRHAWRLLAAKLILFALALVLAVPLSVKTSDLIEDTYEVSIQQTLDNARQTTDTLQENAKELDAEEEEDRSWWQNLVSSAKTTVSNAANDMEQVLNHMIEALAMMIATSCLIPVLVLLFLIWLVKQALHFEMGDDRKWVNGKN